jgi:hypothetical protein
LECKKKAAINLSVDCRFFSVIAENSAVVAACEAATVFSADVRCDKPSASSP